MRARTHIRPSARVPSPQLHTDFPEFPQTHILTRTGPRTHTHTHLVLCFMLHERQCVCVILLFYLIYFTLLMCIPSPVLHERQCALPTPPMHERRVFAVHCFLPMGKMCDARQAEERLLKTYIALDDWRYLGKGSATIKKKIYIQ